MYQHIKSIWYTTILFVCTACSIIDGIAVTISGKESETDSAPVSDTASEQEESTATETDTGTSPPEDTDTSTISKDGGSEQESESIAGSDTPGDSEKTDSDSTTDTNSELNTSDTLDDGLEEYDIPFVDGDLPHIFADDNLLNLQGWWYTFYSIDGMASIEMTPSVEDNTICVNGWVRDPADGNYNLYYGAKVGFATCSNKFPGSYYGTEYSLETCPGENGERENGLDTRMVGISFTLTGDLPQNELRIQFAEQNRQDGTYVAIHRAGDRKIKFEDATLAYDITAPGISIPNIIGIFFYIPSSGGPATFDFCIENLKILAYPE
jgi:hypothetical protein